MIEEQMNIFDYIYEPFKFTKRIALIELFAGIGSQAAALEKLDEDGLLPNGWESWFVCENNKYAIDSYNAVHKSNYPTIDIKDVHASDLNISQRDKYQFLMFYSFPCQDISNAGKKKGFSKGDNTRSGLLWEVERLLNECKEYNNQLPDVLVMENVSAIRNNKNIEDFNKWLTFLEELGYTSFVQNLNARNYGVPQNRERTFVVSILGYGTYEFPKEIELTKTMDDYLDEDVDEKYYLEEDTSKNIVWKLIVND